MCSDEQGLVIPNDETYLGRLANVATRTAGTGVAGSTSRVLVAVHKATRIALWVRMLARTETPAL
jgi:hypothetical protein